MTETTRDTLLVASFAVLAVLLHLTLRFNTISLIPAPLLLANLMAWNVRYPWYWLAVVATLTTLYSTLPLPSAVLAVLLPAFIWRWRGRVEVDLSFSFALLALFTTTLQVLLLAGYDLAAVLLQGGTLHGNTAWLIIAAVASATAAASAIISIVSSNLRPTHAAPRPYGSLLRH